MTIFLIGFRATGKSTIGRLLADRLGGHWIDSDSEIEKFTQKTIPEIFEDSGEAGFRHIEQNVIRLLISRMLPGELTVVSLGGGAVLSDQTRKLIGVRGKCVWLNASASCLAQRIDSAQRQTPRPALTELDGTQEVSQLLQLRRPVYSDCADYKIDTGELNVVQTVEQIAHWWLEVDK